MGGIWPTQADSKKSQVSEIVEQDLAIREPGGREGPQRGDGCSGKSPKGGEKDTGGFFHAKVLAEQRLARGEGTGEKPTVGRGETRSGKSSSL